MYAKVLFLLTSMVLSAVSASLYLDTFERGKMALILSRNLFL